MKKVSIVIPAYNEAEYINLTLQAIRLYVQSDEVIVVDDGSRDATATVASRWADRVVRLDRNYGKGVALQIGWSQAQGDILLLLDADLQESAKWAQQLLAPVLTDECDMAVAVLPRPSQRVGLGLAKGLARHGIRLLTGYDAKAPLSGQRAIRRDVLQILGTIDSGFGVEVGLTVDALRAGFRVQEVPVSFTHRESGNNWEGFWHRGQEFLAVGRTLTRKWRESTRVL